MNMLAAMAQATTGPRVGDEGEQEDELDEAVDDGLEVVAPGALALLVAGHGTVDEVGERSGRADEGSRQGAYCEVGPRGEEGQGQARQGDEPGGDAQTTQALAEVLFGWLKTVTRLAQQG
jgi:hypothetical protein